MGVLLHIRRFAGRLQFLTVATGALFAAATISLGAEECVVLEDFSSSTVNQFPKNWTPREEAGKTVYTVLKEGGMMFVRAKSAATGIEAGRSVNWNIEQYPILRWQWRARVFPRGANEYTGKDDSVLGLYIGFCPPEDLALCERSMKGQLGLRDRMSLPKLLLDKGTGSLKYIWSERLAKGFEFDRGRKAVKVLESGITTDRDRWVQERIDVRSDYRRRFGNPQALNPVGISILTDSDDSNSDKAPGQAEGDYADFRICR
jgi:hypothetical protein